MALESFVIDGFRNFYKIDTAFDRNINYIIGHNGTGKTTFVKALIATMTLNVSDLMKIGFRSIKLVFSVSGLSDISTLTLTRSDETRSELGGNAFSVSLFVGKAKAISTNSHHLRESRRWGEMYEDTFPEAWRLAGALPAQVRIQQRGARFC